MESCIQDIELIKRALKRRKYLFCAQDVPAQEELYKSQGEVMGGIILKGMSHVAQDLMEANRIHKPPKFRQWISPESRVKGEICISEASHVEKIMALTHEGILKMGATIEKKYERKFLQMLKKAIQETSDFERLVSE